MRLIQFKTEDEYQKAQILEGTRGFNHNSVWVTDDELNTIIDYLETSQLKPKNILCHGVRSGKEVKYLKSKLSPEIIIGTDICPLVENLEDIIVHDFHYVKDEWVGKFDLIYSNSLDHSNRPEECVSNWLSCLSPEGLCFIEWTRWHTADLNAGHTADCFGATSEEYESLFNKVGTVIHKLNINSRNAIVFVIKTKK